MNSTIKIDPADYEFTFTKSDYNPNMGIQYWGRERPHGAEGIHIIGKQIGDVSPGDRVRVKKDSKYFIIEVSVNGEIRWTR